MTGRETEREKLNFPLTSIPISRKPEEIGSSDYAKKKKMLARFLKWTSLLNFSMIRCTYESTHSKSPLLPPHGSTGLVYDRVKVL